MDISLEKYSKNEISNLIFHYDLESNKWNCFNKENISKYFNVSNSDYKLGVGNSPEESYECYLKENGKTESSLNISKEEIIFNQMLKWDERD